MSNSNTMPFFFFSLVLTTKVVKGEMPNKPPDSTHVMPNTVPIFSLRFVSPAENLHGE